MPILLSRRLGALRLALACSVLVLVPAGAEAVAMRTPQRAGIWQAQPAKPVRIAKPARVKTPLKAAQAAKPADATAVPVKSADQAGTWTGSEGGRACFRSRRKLWQDDEGWVVKKVNVCP